MKCPQEANEGERSTGDARGGEVHERCTRGRGPREMHEGERSTRYARGGRDARGGEVH